MFTVPAGFMSRHLVPSMILNKTLGDVLLGPPPKSGEGSPEWDSVNVNAPSLLTSTFGDLRMRTWTQDNVGPHRKDNAGVEDKLDMEKTADAAEGSSGKPRATPKVADMRTLNVLADANRGHRIPSPSPFLVVSALPTGILHSSTPKSIAFYFLAFFLTCTHTHVQTHASLFRPF